MPQKESTSWLVVTFDIATNLSLRFHRPERSIAKAYLSYDGVEFLLNFQFNFKTSFCASMHALAAFFSAYVSIRDIQKGTLLPYLK